MSNRDWHSLRVAITGMNNTPDNPGPGYGVARCIRDHREFRGEIIGLGYDALDGGLYHQEVCDAAYLLPLPSAGESRLLSRISEIHHRKPIDVLIPCLDAELLAFCRIRPQLESMGIRMLLPTEQQIRARNKDRLGELCEPLPVSTPETKTIASPTFFDSCIDSHIAPGTDSGNNTDCWQFPLVIKGVFYDARIVHNVHQARSAFDTIVKSWGYPVLVQKFLKGEEVNLTAVGDGTGNMLGAVMMRKQAVTDKGKAWSGVTIRDRRLEALASCLIRALKWQGPLEIEVLRTADGSSHLLEINPRFPAWIYLSHGVECNLPVMLLQMLCGQLQEAPQPVRPGTLFLRYAEELIINLEDYQSMTMSGELEFSSRELNDGAEDYSKVINLFS